MSDLPLLGGSARILRPSDYRAMKWKNGRGVTTELAVEPSDAGVSDRSFLWRVSIADVPDDGPFSRFEGLERHIMVIEGAGMVLRHEEGAAGVELRSFEPYTFCGEIDAFAELLDGPVRDFNLMTKKGAASGSIRSVTVSSPGEEIVLSGMTSLLYICSGTCRVADRTGLGVELSEGKAIRMEDVAGEILSVRARPGALARLVVVNIDW